MPVVDRLGINGPFNATGVGDTPSRKQIFVCRPAKGVDELPCAKKILSTLARKAYRRSVTQNDLEGLLGYFQRGRNEGGSFDAGIEFALQYILADPEFLFRFEPDPETLKAGAAYRIGDLQLASPPVPSFSGAPSPMSSFSP